MTSCDVLIAGAGPVGATLAALVRECDLDCRCIEPNPHWDGADRPIALTYGSRLILERAGMWASLDPTPIEVVHVAQPAGRARATLARDDLGLPALGYVVAARELGLACTAAVAESGALLIRDRLRHCIGGGEHALVELASGQALQARLVVRADGIDRAATLGFDYAQRAVVARLRPVGVPAAQAFEYFAAGGPIGVLPHGDACEVVWSAPSELARRLARMPESEFLAALHQALAGELQFDAELAPRREFPLGLRYRPNNLGRRQAFIGNAAQALHPVAGQGLNLGLRDAFELAEVIADSSAADLGSEAMLRRYAARRGNDRAGGSLLTDFIVRSFSLADPVAAALRETALSALQGFAPARRAFARRMVFGRFLPAA